MKKKLKAKRRAEYSFVCIGCEKNRVSYKYVRAIERLCRNCRRSLPPKNQPSLF